MRSDASCSQERIISTKDNVEYTGLMEAVLDSVKPNTFQGVPCWQDGRQVLVGDKSAHWACSPDEEACWALVESLEFSYSEKSSGIASEVEVLARANQ